MQVAQGFHMVLERSVTPQYYGVTERKRRRDSDATAAQPYVYRGGATHGPRGPVVLHAHHVYLIFRGVPWCHNYCTSMLSLYSIGKFLLAIDPGRTIEPMRGSRSR
jgi:hypothetical protein